jgi:predicted TIM-barrel fold metal-dependent hydrolase
VSKYLIESHCHLIGASPVSENLGDKIKTLADKVAFRSRYPELYAQRIKLPPIDISDALIADMDANGVSHAIIQQDYGRGDNDMVAAQVAKHPDRFFGLIKMHRYSDFAERMPTREELPRFQKLAVEEIRRGVEDLGLIGVGEFFARCFTNEVNPDNILEDFRSIFDVLAEYKIPILIQTAWTQFPHNLWYGNPLWVDEIAGEYPQVPIILTKMGRGFESLFDSALLVAMRNSNVYFDIVDTIPSHLRRAIDVIGSDRILFGSDWCCMTRWVREPADCYQRHLSLLDQANVTEQEREDIRWKTAAKVFRLNLS